MSSIKRIPPFASACIDLGYQDGADGKLPCPRLSRQFAQISARGLDRWLDQVLRRRGGG
jgi:hypothetical protein